MSTTTTTTTTTVAPTQTQPAPAAAQILIPTIPESAPFTEAQRAWLNGFLAGMLSARPLERSAASVAMEGAQPLAASPEPAAPDVEEEFPWHDPALEMDDRLRLAEGRPHARVMMAAMAQLDCGACGYLCQTYAEAIANGEEKDLTRCAPGGRETAKKLKELVARAGDFVPVSQVRVSSSNGAAPAKPTGHNRNNPFPARLLKCEPLNHPASAKDTRVVAFDLKGSGLSYEVGDALGLYPENCPDAVHWILEAFDATGAEAVKAPDGSSVSVHEALLRHYVITRPGPKTIDLLARSAADAAQAAELAAMLGDDGPGIPDGHELIDLLSLYPSARPPIDAVVATLSPLIPRLYSISSSLKAHPGEVHLTVGVVRYANARGRQCKGVASTFLSERLRPGQKARVFVQAAHGFRLPLNGGTDVVMIGPGTGIAPFRAFLQERKATGAKGRNWLFFGDQRSERDFLYREELENYRLDGTLGELDLAFSRDQAEKVYVQHKMLQRGRQLFDWLERGAHLYVCGDAKRMAKDVDEALRHVVAEHGGMSPEAAKAYVTDLGKGKRYQKDVY